MKALWFLTVVILFIYSSHLLANEKLVVVVNKSNPVITMNHSEVIDLFMGKYVAFPNGTKAIAVDLIDKNTNREIFYQKLVGRSLASINAYWSRIRFSGKRKPPIQKLGYEQVVEFVARTETSIAYLPKSMVSSEMKVVFSFDQ